MHANEALIHRFYEALAAHDGATMAACYAKDATFRDPVFTLAGAHVGNRWTMLCERGGDSLVVRHEGVQAGATDGSARWQADYPFSATGRQVCNRIEAKFTFRDGLIARHEDAFDCYAWTRMALGPVGTLLGWTPLIQGKVRRTAAAQLAKWESKRN